MPITSLLSPLADSQKGAQSKAARFGVLLRDLRQLSDEEVMSWGGQTTLILYFYQYSDVRLTVGLPPDAVSKLDNTMLGQELRSHDVVQSAFNAAAKQLDTLNLLAQNDDRVTQFRVIAETDNVFVCGQPILEFGLEGKARLIARPMTLKEVMGYGAPTEIVGEREVTVERFGSGEASVVHHQSRTAIEIDLASVCLPPLSQIRYLSTRSAQEVEHESFGISNPKGLRVAGPIAVDIYEVRRNPLDE